MDLAGEVTDDPLPPHIMRELGFAVSEVGESLVGTATVAPELLVPGLPHLRTSVLATWADHLGGLLAIRAMAPKVPVTVELDVHLRRPAPGGGPVRGVAASVKVGRSLFVFEAEFLAGDEPSAVAVGSFMASPDPGVALPERISLNVPASPTRLAVPLAERARCRRRGPGEAVLPRSEDGLNSSNTVNGGLIALVAEEAALSLLPHTTLCSLALRYLQPVRVGPVQASAQVHDGLGQVRIRDDGADGRLAVLATTRAFPG